MLIACLGLGEEISNLDLDEKVVEGDRMVTNTSPSEVDVHTNMLGHLILDRIDNNLKSPSVVTMKGGVGEVTNTPRSYSSQWSQITS